MFRRLLQDMIRKPRDHLKDEEELVAPVILRYGRVEL